MQNANYVLGFVLFTLNTGKNNRVFDKISHGSDSWKCQHTGIRKKVCCENLLAVPKELNT